MSEWHEEFRAYARAFGKDEVAAILLRSEEEGEWLLWPDQKVEGLTFTLTADSILASVPVEDLQHVVGWVHSHPMGMNPSPSGTDDTQIRELAKDLAGGIAEMWIFGGKYYELYSITRAITAQGFAFVTDTVTWQQSSPSSRWDEVAAQLYKASKPVYKSTSIGGHRGYSGGNLGFSPPVGDASDEEWEKWLMKDSKVLPECQLCQVVVSDGHELCWACDDQMNMSTPGYL